jgi:hypothetical protein
MFTDGAGVCLSFPVPASGQRERGACGQPWITYRHTAHMRSVSVAVFHILYVHRCMTLIYIIKCS